MNRTFVEGVATMLVLSLFAMAYVSKTGPLLILSRGLDWARAVGYLLREMAEGAASRMGRWQECVDRARIQR